MALLRWWLLLCLHPRRSNCEEYTMEHCGIIEPKYSTTFAWRTCATLQRAPPNGCGS